MVQLLKKITTKDICGDVRMIVNGGDDPAMKEGEQKLLYRILGQVISANEKETDKGPYIDMKGRFRATNLLDGEEYAAGRCILVDEASIPIMAQLKMDQIAGVEFAYDIGITARADAIRGYEYYVIPLMDAAEDDPLERLAANLPKLPAPAKVKAVTKK